MLKATCLREGNSLCKRGINCEDRLGFGKKVRVVSIIGEADNFSRVILYPEASTTFKLNDFCLVNRDPYVRNAI